MGISSGTSTAGWLFVHYVQIELEFGKVGFWGEGKTGEPGEKPLGARTRTSNKTQPTSDAESGTRTRATLLGGEFIWWFSKVDLWIFLSDRKLWTSLVYSFKVFIGFEPLAKFTGTWICFRREAKEENACICVFTDVRLLDPFVSIFCRPSLDKASSLRISRYLIFLHFYQSVKIYP